MQMILKFQPDRPLRLPFNYQYQLQSAIYAKLEEIDVSDFWHDEGFGESRKFKAFTFSPLRGKYTVDKANSKLLYEGGVSLELRSPIFSFCDDMQRALELNPRLRLFDTVLTLTSASLSNVHINRNEVVFRTQSPILIYKRLENGKTHYFSPDEDEFYNGICNNYERKFEAVFGFPAEPVQLRPAGQFKKVVTHYKSTVLTAYQGVFEVRGTPASLEFLYNAGLGSKNPQGFGFVSIL